MWTGESTPGAASSTDVDSRPFRVLVADDQSDVREALQLLLKGDGYETELVSGPASLLESLQSESYDLVLLDMNYARDTTSGREGLDLVTQIHRLDPNLPIVVMTAWGNVELAVDAMRRGACDFIEKPWNNRHVLASVRSHIERQRVVRRKQQRWDEELDEAIRIQRRLLPSCLPELPGCQVAGSSRPATFVGGDYFDVVQAGGKLAFCVADVAGKSLPAALLMANLQAASRPQMLQGTNPAEVCRQLNHVVRHATLAGKFISSFHALYQPENRKLTYCNAGHLPPILIRADGTHQRLTDGGAVLGYFSDWNYQQHEVFPEPGSRLLLFSDGITEACDATGEEFGEERLASLAIDNRALSARELQHKILAAVMAHCEGQPQDDATLLVIAVD
jgi:sigma-B regulation protein RsbU (phosphoserine phosphatase)